MSRRIPIAPITLPSALRSAEALSVVGITSPFAERGLSTASRVTPRSTTSSSAAMNSRVSSGLMERERDCSTTSSFLKPSSSETASFAWRILPSRSETNTGSGAFAMMMSATSRPAVPSWAALPFVLVLAFEAGEFSTFLATGCLQGSGAMRVAYSLCLLRVLGAISAASVATRQRDQLVPLVGPFLGLLENVADPADVELVVDRPGLEGRPFLRQQGVLAEAADHLEVVLRLALVVLLAARVADLRVGGHEDAGAGAVDVRLPRPGRAGHMTVAIELGRLLAEVPDVATAILAVPIGRTFLQPAAKVEPIMDDHAGGAGDRLDLVRDGHDVARTLAVFDTRVDVAGAGLEREPGVGHLGAEARRRCRLALPHECGGDRCQHQSGAETSHCSTILQD